MTYPEIVNRVSADTGITTEVVDKTYKAFWLYIRNSLQSFPLKESLTEEEFSNLRPNFNVPSLGKLACTYSRYNGVKKRFSYIKKLKRSNEDTEESKADV